MSGNVKNYQNSKIYTIRSNQTDKFYIGSTVQKLSERFGSHKSLFNTSTSKIIIEYGDAYIQLLEIYPCDSLIELTRREGYHILNNKENTVNKYVAGRTRSESNREYRDANKEAKQKYQREYQLKNKEIISAKNKLYYEAAKKRAATPDASL